MCYKIEEFRGNKGRIIVPTNHLNFVFICVIFISNSRKNISTISLVRSCTLPINALFHVKDVRNYRSLMQAN